MRILADRFRDFSKRLLDLILVVPALILLAPLLLLLATLVYLKLGRPIFFRQQRPGRQGQPFTIFKFRTLTNARDAQGHLLPDADRLTPFGDFLRRSSLDELPELFNILRGEMSMVGPRPLLMRYLNRYTPEQMRRQEIKPGLTGWAQINGRNALTWEEKLNYDVWYIDNWSLGLDLRIILMTLWKVLTRDGISHPGHATMTEFKGEPANGTYPKSWIQSLVEQDSLGHEKIQIILKDSSFSPEFKAQVVLEVLSGVKSVTETCREYELRPQLLARWQADFLENAARAFQYDEPHPQAGVRNLRWGSHNNR